MIDMPINLCEELDLSVADSIRMQNKMVINFKNTRYEKNNRNINYHIDKLYKL